MNIQEKRDALLRAVDEHYGGVMRWLANMYDPATGGFHMAMSGKLDPEMEPALEMTAWAIKFFGYAGMTDSIPKSVKDKLIQFFYDRQDPATGLFIDKQGPVNDRETARNQMSALAACKTLGIPTKYPHPGTAKDAKASADAQVMPKFMASTEAYIEWMETLPWQSGSWHAGDRVESSLQFVRMLPDGERERYAEAILGWLDAHQHGNGAWSDEMNFVTVSGIYKVERVYAFFGRRLPRYEAALETILACYRQSELKNPYFIRNPLSVFLSLCSYGEDVKRRVQEGILANIPPIEASFGKFLCPDGAFCASQIGEGLSMKVFGGVLGSHGLHEGDIDATLMMLIARTALYKIFDLEPKPLYEPDLWRWITGELPTPSAYR